VKEASCSVGEHVDPTPLPLSLSPSYAYPHPRAHRTSHLDINRPSPFRLDVELAISLMGDPVTHPPQSYS